MTRAERRDRRTRRAEAAARARAFRRTISQPAQLRLRRAVRPAERPGHLSTTAHIQAAYPFVAQAGLGTSGVLIGRDVYGGPFTIDPWLMYERKLLHDPNMLIVGRPDHGKSSLVKSMLFRQRVFGRRVEVVDPKGEYHNLIDALDGVIVRLSPGGGTQLNPLERIGSPEQRQSLLLAMANRGPQLPRTPLDVEHGMAAHPDRSGDGRTAAHECRQGCMSAVECVRENQGSRR